MIARAAAVSSLLLVAGCAASAGDAYPPPSGYPQQETPAGYAPQLGQPPYQIGRASYYADRLAGHRTAAGEPYDPRALTAAHRTLPLGTFVDVARADGRHVVVRINDRGPYASGRVIDVSRRAAHELGMERAGVIDVALRVLWVPPRRPRRM